VKQPMTPQEKVFSEIVEELSRNKQHKTAQSLCYQHEQGINAFVAGSGEHDENSHSSHAKEHSTILLTIELKA